MTEIMAARFGFGWGWDVGEDGWKPGVDKNFQMSDTFIGLCFISDALTAPPGSPADGDTYLVAASATGAWATHDGKVAARQAGAWYFYPVAKGLRALFVNLSVFKYYDGSAWTAEQGTLRNKGELMAQFVLGTVVSDGTFYFSYRAPYAGSVASLDSVSGSGTFTLEVAINGTAVTGLDAVAVAGAANTVATALNTFVAGDTITGTISASAGSPTDAVLNLNVLWT